MGSRPRRCGILAEPLDRQAISVWDARVSAKALEVRRGAKRASRPHMGWQAAKRTVLMQPPDYTTEARPNATAVDVT